LNRVAWVVVSLLFCVPLFVGLGLTDMQNDEAIYSFGADVMAASGNWLSPKSSPWETEPFLEKPPLKIWIVAAPIRLGLLPDNEFGLRFWDALFGSAAFLYVFAIGRRIGGSICGVLSVLMLFVQRSLVFEHGLRSNNMEATLVLAYCAGIYHFIAWTSSSSDTRSRFHVFAVALYFVLAFMTKFVAALFLPVIIAAVLLARRVDRMRLARSWRLWLAAAALAVVIVSPWFAYQHVRYGAVLWEALFGSAVYARFTGYLDPAHVQPWHYYLSRMWSEAATARTLLWTLGGLVLLCWRSVRTNRADELTILLWFALPVGLISLGTSKLYHYAYPFLPPLALAAGYVASLAVGAVTSGLEWLSGWVGRSIPRAARTAFDSRVGRRLALAIGVTSCLVALPALAMGSFKLALWGDVVLRVSTPFRVLPVLVLAVLVSRRARPLAVVAAVLILAPVLPVDAYQRNVSSLSVERHPLRSLGECLQRVAEGHADASGRSPIYAEDGRASHPAAFYLRRLGRWSFETASDANVYTSLFGQPRPVLLSASRFRTLDVGDRLKNIPAVPVLDQVMLLPGPFGACAIDNGRSLWR